MLIGVVEDDGGNGESGSSIGRREEALRFLEDEDDFFSPLKVRGLMGIAAEVDIEVVLLLLVDTRGTV